jgi:hypothetical protein
MKMKTEITNIDDVIDCMARTYNLEIANGAKKYSAISIATDSAKSLAHTMKDEAERDEVFTAVDFAFTLLHKIDGDI